MTVDFRTTPDRYRHWHLDVDPPLAFLTMDVDESGGLDEGYELRLNSYDLGVDIELYDATQRLRFEHPEVGAVVITSALDRVFCAGANIRMLGRAAHSFKVNFCKFTNETRNAIEDASQQSGQRYVAAINGNAAGGGYELALACDYLILTDDGSSGVSMPEVPLLAVLPGTGGLTRLTDKRLVRRDRADVFCTIEEGVKGPRAVEWGLVDEVVPRSRFQDAVRERALAMAETSDRPRDAKGLDLTPLRREVESDRISYSHLDVAIDRAGRAATLTLRGPETGPAEGPDEITDSGYWPLALVRELDDALLHMRVNEPEIGLLLLETEGAPDLVAGHDAFLVQHTSDWLVREIVLYWKRTLKRLDIGSRTAFALIEPGSCFVGLLAELALAADRTYMFEGAREGGDEPAPSLQLTPSNLGAFPMSNGISRLETRFWGHPEGIDHVRSLVGVHLDAQAALAAGLVTYAFDEVEWEDELRLAVEERASFSPDSLSAMEANLRFAGPETIETKIFGRLSAWQNWVFSRPNAAGDEGALRRYGTGQPPAYDRDRA